MGPLLLGGLMLGAGCGDGQALRAERDRLAGALERRTAVKLATEQLKAESAELSAKLRLFRQALGPPDVRLLAAGLVEEDATGWLEQRSDGPDRVVMKGPGPTERGRAAVEHAAARAPGLQVREVWLGPGEWKVACDVELAEEVLEDVEPGPTPGPPELEPPPWPFHQDIWADIVRLQAAVEEADGRLGVDVDELARRRARALALETRLSRPDRLSRLPSVLEAVWAGGALEEAHLVFEERHLAGEATLAGELSASELAARWGEDASVVPLQKDGEGAGRVRFQLPWAADDA